MKRIVAALIVAFVPGLAWSQSGALPRPPVLLGAYPPPTWVEPSPPAAPWPAARAIQDPSGLATIRPPPYPPGTYRQAGGACFIPASQYPLVDRNRNGRLSWGELSQFCANPDR